MSKHVPQEFLDEFDGFAEGCKEKMPFDHAWCEKVMGRTQVLPNAPGSVKDIVFVLLDEFMGLRNRPIEELDELELEGLKELAEIEEMLIDSKYSLTSVIESLNWPLAQCSMFGVWGSRTVDRNLFSMRNLDWNANTGINKHKLVTVHHPPEDGKHAHVTFGFASIYGALAGMSAEGLTVHEANLESNRDSFKGFPWLVRLRYIMENAKNLDESQKLWEATDNTVGFNHMIASTADNAALVMETDAKHTAYFRANSTIEAESVAHT